MRRYENGKYDNLIEYRVSRMSFQDEYKPFVIDILKRRALQFDFTLEQVNTDLDRLSKSLKKISAKHINFFFAGIYYSDEKRINLNPIANDLSTNRSLYTTVTHELYHALAVEDGNDTMAGINIYTGQYNSSLLEAFVEKASYRTVLPLKVKNPYYNMNSDGYRLMNAVPEMIAASFGVSENELLGKAIQGRDKLVDFLASKIHQRRVFVEYFLDRFEANLAVIHRNLYGSLKEKDKGSLKGKNIAQALGRMKEACADMMLNNIANIPEEELSQQKIEDLKYNFNKLNVVTKKGFRGLSIFRGFSSKIVDFISKTSMEYCANAIVQTEYFRNFKKTHKHFKGMETIENCARQGRLAQNDFFLKIYEVDKIGMIVPKEVDAKKIFNISKKTIERNQVSKDKTEEWDNSIIKKLGLKRLLRRTHVRDNIHGLKNLLTGGKKEALPPGNNENIYPKYSRPAWFISKDESEKINLNSRKIVSQFQKEKREEYKDNEER